MRVSVPDARTRSLPKGSAPAAADRPAYWFRLKDDNGDRMLQQVLLKRQVSIDRHEHVELPGCKRQQFAVLYSRHPIRCAVLTS